jgi:predicted Rossmann-fold nucleotide-binding protein
VAGGLPWTIAVVGSAWLEAPDPRWWQARELGAALGGRGWRVMTGGYGGLMGAAARGAREAGATVIGLPMRGWSGLTPSRWCDELRWAEDYPGRLRHLLSCDAVVALDGGIGTLAEAAAVWAALQTEPGAARLVLLGAGWPGLLAAFGGALVADAADLALAAPAATTGQAMELLDAMVSGASVAAPGARG